MRLGLTKVGSYVVKAVLGGDCTKTTATRGSSYLSEREASTPLSRLLTF